MPLSEQSLLARLKKRFAPSPSVFLIDDAPEDVVAAVEPLSASIGMPAYVAFESNRNWITIGTQGVTGRNNNQPFVVSFDTVVTCGPIGLGRKDEFIAQFEVFRFMLRDGSCVDSWLPNDNAGFYSLWSTIKMMVGGRNEGETGLGEEKERVRTL